MQSGKTIARALLLAAVVLLAPRAIWAAQMRIDIMAIKGAAKLIRSGSERVLRKGDAIVAGDTLITGVDGEVVLHWADGNVLKLYPLSRITIDRIERSGSDEINMLLMDRGKLYARIKKLASPGSSFNVKTPTATAGARGSEIIVEANGGISTFTVLSGSFEISSDQFETVVGPNFQATVNLNEPLVPQPMQEDVLEDALALAKIALEEAGIVPDELKAPEAGPAGVDSNENPDVGPGAGLDAVINETTLIDTVVNDALYEAVESMTGLEEETGAAVIID